MKQLFILLWLVSQSATQSIDQNATSFQVNVSAGYGVHSENSAMQENATSTQSNHRDQISEPTQNINVYPTPMYQVHEKSADIQEKNFQVNNHRFREKKLRPRKPDINHNNFDQTQLAPSGTRIVEVLRVPAMYELHLQTDPQRLVNLNSALLNKMMGLQNRRPVRHQMHEYPAPKNFYQQANPPNNFDNGATYQKFPPFVKPVGLRPNGLRASGAKAVPVQNFSGFKNNYLVNHNYPAESKYNQVVSTPLPLPASYYRNEARSFASTPLPITYNPSNEIKNDYYQKPQALHEVPAPVLNRHQKNVLQKIVPTTVPSLVYGKPIDPPYRPDYRNNHQSLHQTSQHLNQAYPNHNAVSLNQDQIYQNQNVETDPLYQNQLQQHLQIDPVYQNQNAQLDREHQTGFHNIYHNYKGYQNSQNPYNELIGNHLDQTLVNANGGLSTFWNQDGTMTVSNFHHQPQLYSPSVDGYDVVTEAPQLEESAADFNAGYAAEVPVTEPSVETGDHLNNFGGQSVEPGYGKQITKRMFPRGGVTSRRSQPLDYIVYIKERTFD